MSNVENQPPRCLGLCGDGDEIAAITEVEHRFGVRFDYSDARNWTTVGDVFEALRRTLPLEQAAADDTWARFAEAICMETGVDPSRVTQETLLLGQRRFDWRVVAVVATVLGVMLALVRHW